MMDKPHTLTRNPLGLKPIICNRLGPNNTTCPLPKNHPGKCDWPVIDMSESAVRERAIKQRFEEARQRARARQEAEIKALEVAIDAMNRWGTGAYPREIGLIRGLIRQLQRELDESASDT